VLPPHLLQAQARQLRTRRSPLYVPAVLRPTEAPVGTSPPRKKEGGGVSGVSGVVGGGGGVGGGPNDVVGIVAEPDGVVSPVSTTSIRRMVTEEWNEGSRSEVTGPPSRNHWKARPPPKKKSYYFRPVPNTSPLQPDASAAQCDLAACARRFGVFARRHHCRRCGLIFCAEHSARLVPLDQHARFHDRAPRFRACVDCVGDYGVWAAERARRAAACAPGGGGGAAPGPEGGSGAAGIKIAGGKGGLINTLIAQSVPKDWNWSTF
jgi:hypothetical protein